MLKTNSILQSDFRAVEESTYFNHHTYWTLIGTNYTKADTHTRSRFALTHEDFDELYAKAAQVGLKDFLIISTCNRTEFYGCAPLGMMKKLIYEFLETDHDELMTYFYCLTGEAAIKQFFRVTAGLDSQIVGDYEIMGQVKKAIQQSRENHLTGTLIDRISNFAFQASKEIKTKTNLSSGKYSVSYATTELIRSERKGKSINRVLIVGTGEMGRSTARNLKETFPDFELTLTNRTYEHAVSAADEIGAQVIPFENFTSHLSAFDVVITTVESDQLVIKLKDIKVDSKSLFLDLSVPQVIDENIKNITGVKLFSVDDISAFHNQLISQRQLEIPKAEMILEEFTEKLHQWLNTFYYNHIIQNYKDKVIRFSDQSSLSTKQIDKKLSQLIQKIRVDGYHGCSVIQTVNELISAV